MTGNTKWLLSLEQGKRMVAACFIVIGILAGVCVKLYKDKEAAVDIRDTIIHKNDSICSGKLYNIQLYWSQQFKDYQDKKDKETIDFMKEQLLKAQSIRDNAFDMRERNYQLQKEATSNNIKAKTLIKNEKR